MSRWRVTIPEIEIELEATDEADARSQVTMGDIMDGAFIEEISKPWPTGKTVVYSKNFTN